MPPPPGLVVRGAPASAAPRLFIDPRDFFKRGDKVFFGQQTTVEQQLTEKSYLATLFLNSPIEVLMGNAATFAKQITQPLFPGRPHGS